MVRHFEQVLHSQGLFEALRILNSASIYRFTGVYKFEETRLVKSVVLFDRRNPDLRVGQDVPWKDSYCMLAAEDGQSLEIADSQTDSRLKQHQARNTVQSYCAVLLRYPDGKPLGTLCHFDLRPCAAPPGTIEQLAAAKPALEQFLWTSQVDVDFVPKQIAARVRPRPIARAN